MSVTPIERRRVRRAFGAVLKIMRKQSGLSQEKLSEGADIDPTYASLLERGLRTPTLTTLIGIARTLHIEPTQLVSDTMKRLRGEVQS